MTVKHRYIIVLDRFDDDDHVRDGRPARDDDEGMEQVAAELQEAMDQTGEPAGFFKVIARWEASGEPDVAHTTPSTVLRASVARRLQSRRSLRRLLERDL